MRESVTSDRTGREGSTRGWALQGPEGGQEPGGRGGQRCLRGDQSDRSTVSKKRKAERRGGLGLAGCVRPGPEPGPHPLGTGRHAGYGQGGDRKWRTVWNGVHGCWVTPERALD